MELGRLDIELDRPRAQSARYERARARYRARMRGTGRGRGDALLEAGDDRLQDGGNLTAERAQNDDADKRDHEQDQCVLDKGLTMLLANDPN
jgi:hypothetical protein